MPKAEPKTLRIFCICGQKMRVTASMFGKPGKCVACRQKIRIPSASEIPADSTEIHLKDHPELLRKPGDRFPALEEQEEEEVELGRDGQLSAEAIDTEELSEDIEAREPPGVMEVEEPRSAEPAELVPLDGLYALRVLCSFEHKLRRLIQEAPAGEGSVTTAPSKSELVSYRGMVSKARMHLDRRLREELGGAEEQLQQVKEEIARASLSVRAGEVEHEAYLRTAAELRGRREVLTRRTHNLRGWLQTQDPYLAGGYVDLPLSEVPYGEMELEAFDARPPEGAVLNYLIEELRHALRGREAALHKRREWRSMARTGSLMGAVLTETQAEARAERTRTVAWVTYARKRLEQLVRDCESDIKAVKAQLRIARERLQATELSRPAYHALEGKLLRAQADITKAHRLVQHALLAETATDVPLAEGTFIQRLSHRAQPRKRWHYFAGAAVVLLLIAAGIAAALLLTGILPPQEAQPAVASPEVESLHYLGLQSPLDGLEPRLEAQEAPGEPASPDWFPTTAEASEAPQPPPPRGYWDAPRLELVGIINAEGHSPRFYVMLHRPGYRESSRYLNLTDRIHGAWHASEFNPVTQKLTITDGEAVIILQPGDSVRLEGGE